MHLLLPPIIGLVLFGALIDVVEAAGAGCFLAAGQCPHPNVTFWLRTRDNEQGSQVTYDYIDVIPLMEDAPLVVLVHGYTGNKDYSPNMELVPAYMYHGGYNVISVDWGYMAQEGCYIQAAFNVVIAGRCTGHFLAEFFRRRGDHWREKTHVVGFSLGAHVTGIVGHYLRGSLPRITGLDPALPLFTSHTANLPDRLDPSDARFIDIYHSNAGWKGRVSPLGHVDFYINNGGRQPGCVQNTSCDHVRAVEIFAESINSPTGFYGEPCTVGVTSFLSGWAKEACPVNNDVRTEELLAGQYVDNSARGTYKIETNNTPPYARGRKYMSFTNRRKKYIQI